MRAGQRHRAGNGTPSDLFRRFFERRVIVEPYILAPSLRTERRSSCSSDSSSRCPSSFMSDTIGSWHQSVSFQVSGDGFAAPSSQAVSGPSYTELLRGLR